MYYQIILLHIAHTLDEEGEQGVALVSIASTIAP